MSAPHENHQERTDFWRLWTGSTISQLGSAVGMVALPIIAVIVVRASAFEVALLAALTAVTTQPLFIVLGGLVATWADARRSLFAAAGVMCAAALLLPRS
ncbi:hypothetical protein ABGB18_47215 [Nonomuraea sp. B12E4]|uniref:hypothetical protein n=1 Tax=Nonomuraea sp. B12E4 TaxID=3153564 RepID=UPI00325E0F17